MVMTSWPVPTRLAGSARPSVTAASTLSASKRASDRPVGLGLQDQAAVELEPGAEQQCQGCGFRKHARHRRRIAVAVDHGRHGRAEPGDAAAQVQLVDLERHDNVVGAAGDIGDGGHRAYMAGRAHDCERVCAGRRRGTRCW
jgi:urease beta subunit